MSLNIAHHERVVSSLVQYIEDATSEHIVNFADLEDRYIEVYGKLVEMLKHVARKHKTANGQNFALHVSQLANTYFIELNALRQHRQTTLIEVI